MKKTVKRFGKLTLGLLVCLVTAFGIMLSVSAIKLPILSDNENETASALTSATIDTSGIRIMNTQSGSDVLISALNNGGTNSGKYYLGEDIVIGGSTASLYVGVARPTLGSQTNVTSVNVFSGILYGNGHTITINTTAYATTATSANSLGTLQSTTQRITYAGLIVGRLSGTIQDCKIVLNQNVRLAVAPVANNKVAIGVVCGMLGDYSFSGEDTIIPNGWTPGTINNVELVLNKGIAGLCRASGALAAAVTVGGFAGYGSGKSVIKNSKLTMTGDAVISAYGNRSSGGTDSASVDGAGNGTAGGIIGACHETVNITDCAISGTDTNAIVATSARSTTTAVNDNTRAGGVAGTVTTSTSTGLTVSGLIYDFKGLIAIGGTNQLGSGYTGTYAAGLLVGIKWSGGTLVINNVYAARGIGTRLGRGYGYALAFYTAYSEIPSTTTSYTLVDDLSFVTTDVGHWIGRKDADATGINNGSQWYTDSRANDIYYDGNISPNGAAYYNIHEGYVSLTFETNKLGTASSNSGRYLSAFYSNTTSAFLNVPNTNGGTAGPAYNLHVQRYEYGRIGRGGAMPLQNQSIRAYEMYVADGVKFQSGGTDFTGATKTYDNEDIDVSLVISGAFSPSATPVLLRAPGVAIREYQRGLASTTNLGNTADRTNNRELTYSTLYKDVLYNGTTVDNYVLDLYDTNGATASIVLIDALDNPKYGVWSGSVSNNITINPVDYTVAVGIAPSKTYDGGLTATMVLGTNYTVSGTPASGQTVAILATGASFTDKTAVNGKTVTFTFTLTPQGGIVAGNYRAIAGTGATYVSGINSTGYTFTTTANIDQLGLTITGVTADNRDYDGTNAVSLDNGSLQGVLGVDAGKVGFTLGNGTISDIDANTSAKSVTTAIALTGADAANYSLTQPSDVTVTIGKVALAINVTSTVPTRAFNNEYDATVTYGTHYTYGAMVGSESFTFTTGTAAYATKDVANGITITFTFTITASLSGAKIANYNIIDGSADYQSESGGTYTVEIPGNITKVDVTLDRTGTAPTKVYDGGFSATLTYQLATFGVGDLSFTLLEISALYASKNVSASPILITFIFEITGNSGALQANYNITSGTDTTYVSVSGNQYTFTTTGTITAASLVINYTGSTPTKEYDKDFGVGTLSYSHNATGIGTESFGLATQSAAYAAYGVANGIQITLIVRLTQVGGALLGNYVISAGTGGLTYVSSTSNNQDHTFNIYGNITRKTLTIEDVLATNKTYDGLAAVSLSGGSLVGVLTGDDVDFTINSGAAADKNAADGKSVTASITLTGTDEDNYTLTSPDYITVNIAKITLTITDVTAPGRTYNGYRTVALSGGNLVGVLLGETVTVDLTNGGTIESANARPLFYDVVTDIALSGADALNYTLTQPNDVTVAIAKAPLTITGATAENKPYDGDPTATVTSVSFSLSIDTWAVGINYTVTGTFASSVQGLQNVTVTVTLIDAAALNYIFFNVDDDTFITTATITQIEITINGAAVDSRIYDGGTVAALSDVTLGYSAGGGLVYTTDFTAVGAFDTKNVGTGKTVYITITLDPTISGNYTIANNGTFYVTTGEITVLDVTVSGFTVDTRAYNGSTDVTALVYGGTINGQILLDTLGVGITAVNTSSANAGTYNNVAVTAVLTGADAGNYNLTSVADVSVTIGKADITVTGAVADDKVYDGGVTANISSVGFSGTAAALIKGTDYTVSATFGDKNVAAGKTVTGTVALTGTAANNYDIISSTTVTDTADISKLDITINGFGVSGRDYNGSADVKAQVTGGTIVGTIGGDDLSFTIDAVTASSPNAGTYTVTPTITLGGADADNYNAVIASVNITIAKIQAVFSVTREKGNLTVVNDGGYTAEYSIDGVADWQAGNVFGDLSDYKKYTVNIRLTGDDAINYFVESPIESKYKNILVPIGEGLAALLLLLLILFIIIKKKKDKEKFQAKRAIEVATEQSRVKKINQSSFKVSNMGEKGQKVDVAKKGKYGDNFTTNVIANLNNGQRITGDAQGKK